MVTFARLRLLALGAAGPAALGVVRWAGADALGLFEVGPAS